MIVNAAGGINSNNSDPVKRNVALYLRRSQLTPVCSWKVQFWGAEAEGKYKIISVRWASHNKMGIDKHLAQHNHNSVVNKYIILLKGYGRNFP